MKKISGRKYYIAPIHEAPEWMVDNNNLHTGYRVNYTLKDVTMSLFQKHNDLLNIWTHFVGMIFFLSLMLYLASNRHQSI